MSDIAVVYGYKLGGPGRWNLTGFSEGDQLIVPWYDERNPVHDFPERAMHEIVTGGRPTTADRKTLAARQDELPYMLDEAIELSPPEWVRGRDFAMPYPDAPPLALDGPALSEYVLYIHDSWQETKPYELGNEYSDDVLAYRPPGELASLDPRLDWDSLLDGALAELGLRAPRVPDWFWYRRPTTPAYL